MAQKPKDTIRRPKTPLASLDGDPLGVALKSRQRRFGASSRFLWLLGHWIAFSSGITMGFYAWRAPWLAFPFKFPKIYHGFLSLESALGSRFHLDFRDIEDL